MAGLDTFFRAAPAAAAGARQGFTDIRNTLADVEAIDQQYRNVDERKLLQAGLSVPDAVAIAQPRAGFALPVNPLEIANRPMGGEPLPEWKVPEPAPQPAGGTNNQQQQLAPNKPVVGTITRPATGAVTPEAQREFEASEVVQPAQVAPFKPGIGPFAGKQFDFLRDGPSLVNPLLTTDKKINESAYQATRKELERLTNEAKAKQQKAGPLAGNEEFFYYKNQLDYLDTTFNALKKQNKVVPIQAVPEQQTKTRQYEKRTAVADIGGYELPNRLVRRFSDLRDRMPAELQKPTTQGLLARAQQFGVDPAAAMAIFAMENNYGGQATSGAGAKGSMQIIPDTYAGVRAFFTNNKNGMPAQLAQVAASLPTDINKATPDQLRDAGLLYLYQLQNVNKIPTNLLGAAYHSGPNSEAYKQGVAPNKYDKVAKIWTPDYNAMYVGLYNNYVNLVGGQGQQQVAQQPAGNTQDLRGAFPNTDAKMRSVQVDNTGKTVSRPEDMKPGDSLDRGISLPVINVTGKAIDDSGTQQAPAPRTVKDEALNQSRRALSMTPQQHNYAVSQILRDRELAVQSYERGKNDAYMVYQSDFQNLNARRQLLATQAEAARRVGNVRSAATILDQINTLDNQINQSKYRYLTAVNTLDGEIQTGLRGVDNNLSLALAYQGLNDLKYRNDPTRIERMWSQFSGSEVRIQPRSDGNYNLWVAVNGQLAPAGVFGREDLANEALVNIIPSWAEKLAQVQAAQKSKLFDIQLETWKDTQKVMAESLGRIRVEEIKGDYSIITERMKLLGYENFQKVQGPNGEMLVGTSKDGNAIMQIDVNPTALDKDGTYKRESVRVLPNPARAGLTQRQ